MTRQVFDFSHPNRFVVGTVGEPGERVFYLQARKESRLTSVALEKSQVAMLSDRIDLLLDEMKRRESAGSETIPDRSAVTTIDLNPLDVPISEEFRVGTLALGWSEDEHCILIEAHAVSDEDVPDMGEDAENAPDVLRVRLSAGQAREFAERARRVVLAGRPPCPFCDQPLDASGHVCPRANGFHRG
jgi:uncharacterized repeat protein (TIGR03847 family)